MLATLHKWLPKIALLVLFVGALYLRLHNLVETSFFDVDTSRDLIAVDHIVRYQEHHLAVPDAAGSENKLKNSPVYYYVLIPFYLLGKSPEGMLYVLNITASLNVFVFYLIGKRLKNHWAGLLCAALFGWNILYVEMTSNILQPFFLSVFLPWGFLVMLVSWQKKSVSSFVGSLLIFGLAIHIHSSVLTLVVPFAVYFVAMNAYFWKRNRYVVFFSTALVAALAGFWIVASGQLSISTNIFSYLFNVLVRHHISPVSSPKSVEFFPEVSPDFSLTVLYVAVVWGLCLLSYFLRRTTYSLPERQKQTPVHIFFGLLSCLQR